MRYRDKSFTVPASAGNAAYCAEHGHTLPDAKGKCLRCAAKVRHAEIIDRWPALVSAITEGDA